MKYYSLYFEANDIYGVAYSPIGVHAQMLYRRGFVSDWRTLEFVLKDGVFSDYQANNMGWHLCSRPLKAVIMSFVSRQDHVQWLPIMIKGNSDDRNHYYILHLTEPRNVLSRARTIFSDDHVIKPVLNARAIGVSNVFTYADAVKVYVSGPVRRAILAAGMKGIDFL